MRLASFDFVTAVAVIGAIDAMHGHDTVMPPLDLSQTVPDVATVDLTDFDLDALMSVEIGPASPPADPFDIDLGEFDLEQLLALEALPANTADGPQVDIAVAAFEDLIQVEVRAAEPDWLPLPIDLTGLALETLQDLQFGEDPLRTKTPLRQFATLDLTSQLDQDELNQIVLIDGSVEPSSADSSPYEVIESDPIGTDTATSHLTPVDDAPITVAPVASPDSVAGTEDSAITLDLLANDSDPDGDALTITSVGPAGNGTVTLNADGTVTYTPDPDFSGVDSFDYTIDDGNGGTATATATVTVAAVNDAPVASDDSAAGTEDTAIVLDLLANDSDPDGDALTVTTVGPAGNGTVTINADGTVTYTPDPDFSGVDSFDYTIDDGNGGTASATATVTVAAVNDAPVATDDSVAGTEDSAIVLDLLANDSDPDGDALTVTTVGPAGNGTVTLNADGTVTYTPDPDFSGVDSFDYTIDDGNGGTASATATVTVAPVNDAPVAKADSFTGTEDTDVTGNVLANDTDPDGDALSVTAGTFVTANGGSVVMAADGSFTYTPPADFHGADSFDYTIDDGNGGTASATATIDVAPVNDAPVANPDSFAGTEDTPIVGNLLLNDGDPDGDPLTVTAGAFATLAGGAVVIAADGSFTYTPPADFNGIDSVDYTVSDDKGGTATATVTFDLAPVNDAPVTTDDGAAFDGTMPVTIAVLANDSDPDGDPLTVISAADGASGTVAINADGTVTYTPGATFSGSDTFTYTVGDGNGATATATVTVVAGGMTLIGTIFADILIGGALADYIDGLAGDDILIGLAGNDSLYGGDGNDVLEGAAGADILSGGLGSDTASYVLSAGGVSIDLALGTASGGDAKGDSLSGIENVIGSNAADSLSGDGADNVLAGGGANDKLSGGGGNDALYGGDGNDKLEGGDGDDTLDGGFGGDNLDGGVGNDTASYAGSGAAVSIDLALGTASGGDAESDVLTSIESLIGSAFDDLLRGDDQANMLFGNGGNDVLDGGGGGDSLIGGDGDDILVWDSTDTVIDGGTGTDTLLVPLGDLDLSVASGTVSGIEIVDLRADTAANTVTLTAADVLAISDSGTLAIVGDIGDTAAIGAGWTFEGFDLTGNAVYTQTVGGKIATLLIGPDVTVSLASSPGIVLNGGPGDDILTGTAGDDTLNGRAGDDTLTGGAGADSLTGSSGIDTVSYADSGAGVSVSLQGVGTASGGDAEGDTLVDIENLEGSAYDDVLIGGAGRNDIYGLDGNDILIGGTGDDVLLGGNGDDIVDGGLGNDIFVFSPGTGSDADIVSNFTIGEDLIDLTGFGLTGITDLSISADSMGAALIGLPSGDSITLGAVDPALLTNSDFIF